MTHLIVVNRLGSHNVSPGIYIIRIKQAHWMATKGQTELYMSPIVISGGTTPFSQKRVIPKGGLIRSISALTVNNTPNHNGSNPKIYTMGRKMGMVIKHIPEVSMNMPRKKKINIIAQIIPIGEISSPTTRFVSNSEAPAME